MKKKKEKTVKAPSSRKKTPFVFKAFLHNHRYALILIFAGILLRFVDLGRQGLWIDEMCCWNDAHSSFERIFNTVHGLVFLLEKLSMKLGGDHEYFLRLPSAFGGLLGLIFMYPLAYILFENRKASLYALALLAFSPINVYYSQDANYYGLMMGFTVASLYFLFRFMKDYNPLWLAFYALVTWLNHHVHLANILLVACQLVILGAFIIIDRNFRKRMARQFSRITRNRSAAFASGGVALALLCYGGYRFFGFIYRMAIRSYGTVLAENLEFSPRFFFKLAMDYGVAFQQYSLRVAVLTAFFVIFFLWGLFYSFKKRPFFALFVLLSFTLPFIAIYVKKIGHFYHCRYTAFIVPGYLLTAAAGIHCLETFLRSKNKDRFARAGVFLAFFIVAMGMLPNLLRYYTGHKQDWKGAVLYLKKNMKPGEKVTSNLFCNDSSLRFYFKRFGMDEDPVVKLAGEFRGASHTGLFRLKKLCFLEPGVYFAISYTRYEDRRIWEWVKSRFTEVFHRPSLHPEEFNREGKEVILYKFKYSGSFVFPPYAYHHHFDPPYPLKASPEKELLFGADGQFRIVFECENLSGADEYEIRVKTSDGEAFSQKALFSHKDDRTFLDAVFSLDEGPHSVSLMKNGDLLDNEKALIVSVFPEIAGVYHREAEDTDLYHPTPWKRIETIVQARCFTLERQNYVYYDRIPFFDGGGYGIRIRALDDKPGPVAFEASLNWRPVGVFVLSKGDNSWTDCFFPIDVPPGEHTLSFHFISPPDEVDKLIAGKMPSDRDQDTDLHLDYFEIKRLAPDEDYPDTRFVPKGSVVRKPSWWLDVFENPKNSKTLAPGWQLNPAHDFVFRAINEEDYKDAVKIIVPYDSKGFNLISPAIPVKPDEVLYFSSRLKVQYLGNHTANMRVIYMDKDRKVVKVDIVNADGITGSADWIRQVYLRRAPPGAAGAAIVFWVYPNSRRFSRTEGVCYINPVQFEQFPNVP